MICFLVSGLLYTSPSRPHRADLLVAYSIARRNRCAHFAGFLKVLAACLKRNPFRRSA